MNPQNQYALSKHAQEQIALQLGKRYGIPSVAMRYSIVQGPRQSFWNAYSGACRVFCLSFHVGRVPPIYEDGLQVRDFVNVHDVVDANLRVLEDPRADGKAFNVGGGRAYSVAEFAGIVARAYGRDLDVEALRRLPLRGHAPHRVGRRPACAGSAGSPSGRPPTASPSTSSGCARTETSRTSWPSPRSR